MKTALCTFSAIYLFAFVVPDEVTKVISSGCLGLCLFWIFSSLFDEKF